MNLNKLKLNLNNEKNTLCCKLKIDLTDSGERQHPDDMNWGYFANVSIYKFASQYCQNVTVLDAGCGLGYGTKYLIENGIKKVVGIDKSEKAIEYDKKTYSNLNIKFLHHDLNQPLPFENSSFDFIFTSNAMEHVEQSDKLILEFCRILKQNGTILLGVPPVTEPGHLKENIRNVYHISNYSILGWFTKLRRYFHEVKPYRHWVKPEWKDENNLLKHIDLPAKDTKIRENDFTFENLPIEITKNRYDTITAIFLATKPRNNILPPSIDEFIPHSWALGKLYSIIRIEEENKLKEEIKYWKSEYEKVLAEQTNLRKYIDQKFSNLK